MPHITVCICTYKRPQFLKGLLEKLDRLETNGAFTYSVVVADNDHLQSARQVVQNHAATSSVMILYCVEPLQNIAMARNRAVTAAFGDYIAFIDDDELPGPGWLFDLLQTAMRSDADGVLGPVVPYFEHDPPAWAIKGKFFERPDHPTGFRLDWREARTGNVLFKRDMVEGVAEPFRPEFASGGEDTDFFRRMALGGRKFVWCHEAAVHELVPRARCSRGYLLRRALLRGCNLPKRGHRRIRSFTRSLLAVPCYAAALPICVFSGQHVFLKYSIKLIYHAGHLLASCGLPLAQEKEM